MNKDKLRELADKDYGNGVKGPSLGDYIYANSDVPRKTSWAESFRGWHRPLGILTVATSVLTVEHVMAQQNVSVGDQVQVQSDANIRSGAGTDFADIGDVSVGELYTINGIATDAQGYAWYQIKDANGTILGYVRRDKFVAAQISTQGSTSQASEATPESTSTGISPEITKAIQNGELLASPDNTGYVLAGFFGGEVNPESLTVFRNAISAHQEMLLPSIEAGQRSTLLVDGRPVEYGLLSKDFLATVTGGGYTKDVYKHRYVARFKGSIEVPSMGGYDGYLIMIFELKAKTGQSFNIVTMTTTRITTKPMEVYTRLGSMKGNNADQLDETDIPSSARILHTMENPRTVGQDVILEALNNFNPDYYPLDLIQDEQAAYTDFENAISSGTPFTTNGGPNVWMVYVPESLVVD